MKVRIVVADERQAHFFDASRADGPFTPRGSLQNGAGGLKDIDLETDRPGRRFGGGAGARHAVDGERSTEQHELTLFAKDVAQRIDKDRVNHAFDKLVLIAPPKMLGLLRQALPSPAQSLIASEVPKNIVQQGPEAIRNLVPRRAFSQLQ